MTEVAMTVAVSTGREHRPVSGADTTILAMPDGFYVDVGAGKPALVVQPFSRFLRKLAEDQAAALGETLHHAEFWVTTDPELVRERGTMHDCPDCPDCQDGMARAMTMMASHPGQEMVVGRLFWAG